MKDAIKLNIGGIKDSVQLEDYDNMNENTVLKFPKNYYNIDISNSIFGSLLEIPVKLFKPLNIEEFIEKNDKKEKDVMLENGIISVIVKDKGCEKFKTILHILEEMQIPYDLKSKNGRTTYRPEGTKELLQDNYRTAEDIDIDLVKKVTERNREIFERDGYDSSNCKTFSFFEIAIHDPYTEETGRFDVDPIKYYGEENIRKFIS